MLGLRTSQLTWLTSTELSTLRPGCAPGTEQRDMSLHCHQQTGFSDWGPTTNYTTEQVLTWQISYIPWPVSSGLFYCSLLSLLNMEKEERHSISLTCHCPAQHVWQCLTECREPAPSGLRLVSLPSAVYVYFHSTSGV